MSASKRHPVRNAARSAALQPRDLSPRTIPDQRSGVLRCSASGMTSISDRESWL